MAELLILNSTPSGTTHTSSAGDIIAIHENGHNWGAGELDTNIFTIVKQPNVKASDLQYAVQSVCELHRNAGNKIHALNRHMRNKPRAITQYRKYKYIDNQIIRK